MAVVTKDHADKLSRIIESTGLAQAVNVTHGDNRVSVMCRVASENDAKWIDFVKALLTNQLDEAKELHAWQCHICRNYFIKENPETRERKLVWGWNVAIHSPEMPYSLEMIQRIALGKPLRTIANNEVTSFPLQGSPTRNVPKNGKGAHMIGNGDFSPARTNK